MSKQCQVKTVLVGETSQESIDYCLEISIIEASATTHDQEHARSSLPIQSNKIIISNTDPANKAPRTFLQLAPYATISTALRPPTACLNATKRPNSVKAVDKWEASGVPGLVQQPAAKILLNNEIALTVQLGLRLQMRSSV
jgi:hypothetical protein